MERGQEILSKFTWLIKGRDGIQSPAVLLYCRVYPITGALAAGTLH